MIDVVDQLFEHKEPQAVQIHDHATALVEFAAQRDLDDPVVAMPVLIVADAIDAPILFRRPSRVVQPVTGGELLDVSDFDDLCGHGRSRKFFRETLMARAAR